MYSVNLKNFERVPKLYETDGVEEKYAYLHFYNMMGRGDWFVVEAKVLDDGDVYCYGYVKSPLTPDFDEWGYFTLNELKSASFIVFDTGFKKQLVSEVI